jgi:uncharacterized protein DUF4360
MNKRIAILSILGTLAIVGVASPALAEAPEYVRINDVQYRGPACPPGTADVDALDNNTAFLVTYSTFQVQAGPGLPLTEASKHCNLVVDIEFPRGWSFSVASIAYRGNAILDDWVRGRFRARYNFPGTRSISQDVVIHGPYLGDFELIQPFDVYAWSPCGTGQTSLLMTGTGQVDNLSAPRKSGILTAEQTDGKFTTVINLRWRRC